MYSENNFEIFARNQSAVDKRAKEMLELRLNPP